MTAHLLVGGAASAQKTQEPGDPIVEQQPVAAGGQQQGGATSEQNAAPKPDRTPELLTILQDIEAAIRGLIPYEDEIERQRDRQREIADLEAQQGMAFWALWMFIATGATVLLTAVGVLLIWRTLHHTRRAADYAKDMVKEAERTTEAAFAAVKVSGDTAEKQLRAYVNISYAVVKWLDGQKIGIRITMKNSGATPALDVEHWMRAGHGEVNDFPTGQLAQNRSKNDMGSGFEGGIHDTFGPIHDNQWADLRKRRRDFYVWGEITYHDIFGKEIRHTDFRLRLDKDSNVLVPCQDGNRCT